MFDDSIRHFLGFNARTFYEEDNLLPDPVDILSFDNIFIECDIAQGMIFRGKRSGIFQNFTMDVDPGYKYIDKFRGNVQWYMMQSRDNFSTICFKLKIENNQLISLTDKALLFDYPLKKYKINHLMLYDHSSSDIKYYYKCKIKLSFLTAIIHNYSYVNNKNNCVNI